MLYKDLLRLRYLGPFSAIIYYFDHVPALGTLIGDSLILKSPAVPPHHMLVVQPVALATCDEKSATRRSAPRSALQPGASARPSMVA